MRTRAQRTRRSVDLSRAAWEASRSGRRGEEALEVLQDALMERYPRELQNAIRLAKHQNLNYVVVFVPWLARKQPGEDLSIGERSILRAMLESSRLDPFPNAGIHVEPAQLASAKSLAKKKLIRSWTFKSKNEGLWTFTEDGERLASKLLSEGAYARRPFVVLPSGRTPHMMRTSVVVWDSREDSFKTHSFAEWRRKERR